jgi:hypothetical protein
LDPGALLLRDTELAACEPKRLRYRDTAFARLQALPPG